MTRWLKSYISTLVRDIPWIGASEIRIASLLIGVTEMVWSFTGLVPAIPGSIFSSVLRASGMGDEWFIVMMLIGGLTVVGAVLPWRSGRHIGLFLSALVWFTLTGVFVGMLTVAPVAAMMPVYGVFSIGIMYADARRKPREKLDS